MSELDKVLLRIVDLIQDDPALHEAVVNLLGLWLRIVRLLQG